MGVFLGNFNPDSTFTSDVGSVTRLATSAPFARYLAEAIYQQSAFVQAGILGRNAGLSNTTGSRIEAPFFDPIDSTEESIQSNDTWVPTVLVISPAKRSPHLRSTPRSRIAALCTARMI